MMELEKKILLTVQEYGFLLNQLKVTFSETQVNYYFDTDDFEMDRRGITYRVRCKNGIYIATVKCHSQYDRSIEVNISANAELDESIFLDQGLSLQGSLKTRRSVMLNDRVCEMVLDHNVYLDTEDYELEIEYDYNYEVYVEKVLNNIAESLLRAKLIANVEEFLSRQGKSKNKSSRFFERKTKQKTEGRE